MRQRVPVQPPGFFRKFHYTLMFLFALFSCLFIVGCAIWINYKSIFQSGIIGFFHVLLGVLVGIFITSNVVDEFSVTAAANGAQQTRSMLAAQREKREYLVFKHASASIIVIAVIAIAFSGFYLYNLLNIIINVCPAFHSETAQLGSISKEGVAVPTFSPAVIELHLIYEHVPVGEYYKKKNILILRYNTSSKEIIRKTKYTDPSQESYNQWFAQNEFSNAYGGASMAGATTPITFCLNASNNMLFAFLENELKYELYRNLEERRGRQSVRLTDHKHVNTRMDNEDEEDMDLRFMTRKICRNEYAFAIAVVVFLILWDILSLFIIAYNIWLLRT